MNRIDRMLQELCPEGVEYKKLGDVVAIKNGKDYKHLGKGNIPLYGSGGIMAHVDDYVYAAPTVLIPRKGSLGNLFYVDTPFWNVDTIFYTVIDTEQVIAKFLYYILLNEHLEGLNKAGGVPSLTQSTLNKIEIPVPPLHIQEEIIRILDHFTELTASLQAELQARQEQYEYYRNKLLTFTKIGGGTQSVTWMRMSEILVSIRTGLNPRRFFKLNTPDARNYYVTIREIKGGRLCFSEKTDRINNEALKLCNNRSNLEIGDVLFSGTGTIGETFVITENPTNWNIKEGVYSLKTKKEIINPSYLRYILMAKHIRDSYMAKVEGGTVKSISMKLLGDLKIPVPSLSKQQSIVSILDKFETLVNDLSQGLPAEIAAVQEQYEFYRNKLLTFKRIA